MELIVILVIAVVLAGWFILTYNKFVQMIEAVTNSEKEISVQLDRRGKVFDSLIAAVKKYMDYEKTTLKDVVALRNQAKQAQDTGDFKGRILAEEGLTKIASGIQHVPLQSSYEETC